MKLYHGDKIIPGLIAFVIMITFPIWFNLAPGQADYDAEMQQLRGEDTPEGCIFDTDEMRTSHMQKLSEWRDLVVRDEQRYTEDKNGKQVKMSLTSTCMSWTPPRNFVMKANPVAVTVACMAVAACQRSAPP